MAHLGRRIGWRTLLGLVAVSAVATAYLQVVSAGSRQSDRRQLAQAELNAAGASCENLRSHQERTRCRAALHPLPRENAELAAWTLRRP